jgi:hypothetical protein
MEIASVQFPWFAPSIYTEQRGLTLYSGESRVFLVSALSPPPRIWESIGFLTINFAKLNSDRHRAKQNNRKTSLVSDGIDIFGNEKVGLANVTSDSASQIWVVGCGV